MEMTKISLQSGSVALTAEGTEAFVREMIGMWGSLQSIQPSVIPENPENAPGAGPAKSSSSAAPEGSLKFENVFDSVDGKLKIIAHVPGKSNAERTRNTALIMLYGHLLQGTELLPSEMIRQACTDQGCYDNTNFAGYLKGLKSRVVMNTKSGGGYDVKLTAPGRKDAKELVDLVNGVE